MSCSYQAISFFALRNNKCRTIFFHCARKAQWVRYHSNFEKITDNNNKQASELARSYNTFGAYWYLQRVIIGIPTGKLIIAHITRHFLFPPSFILCSFLSLCVFSEHLIQSEQMILRAVKKAIRIHCRIAYQRIFAQTTEEFEFMYFSDP